MKQQNFEAMTRRITTRSIILTSAAIAYAAMLFFAPGWGA